MIFRAYAKINIGLRILGKRPDGYHDIETIFHQVDLYDELEFHPNEIVKLSTSSPDVPCDSSNLCIRAAELLRKHTESKNGIDIRLTKRIPVGGGLGGGSSDAATVLAALNKQWGIRMRAQELVSLAAELGSDVPFFLQGGTAVGTSRGETLDYFELDMPFWILTATPPIHVSTAWAYSNARTHAAPGLPHLRILVERGISEPRQMRDTVKNDFEQTVFQHHAPIAELKESLDRAGAVFSQLSGSGSSVYGFFESRTSAQNASSRLPQTLVTSLTAPDFKPIHGS